MAHFMHSPYVGGSDSCEDCKQKKVCLETHPASHTHLHTLPQHGINKLKLFNNHTQGSINS